MSETCAAGKARIDSRLIILLQRAEQVGLAFDFACVVGVELILEVCPGRKSRRVCKSGSDLTLIMCARYVIATGASRMLQFQQMAVICEADAVEVVGLEDLCLQGGKAGWMMGYADVNCIGEARGVVGRWMEMRVAEGGG